MTTGRAPEFDRAASAAINAERMEARTSPRRRSKVEGEIRAAGKVLAEMYDSSPVEIDGPTPERARQAGADFEIGEAVRSVEIVKDRGPQTETIRTARVSVGHDPLTRLIQRGELDREDEDMNKRLGAAGLRYRRLRERAGASCIKGQDLSRGFSTAGTASDVLDKMLDAWTWWDKARSAVQPQMWKVLDGVVLEGRKLEDVGSDLGRVQDRKRGQTIGLVVLRLALAALDEHFDKVDHASPGLVPA